MTDPIPHPRARLRAAREAAAEAVAPGKLPVSRIAAIPRTVLREVLSELALAEVRRRMTVGGMTDPLTRSTTHARWWAGWSHPAETAARLEAIILQRSWTKPAPTVLAEIVRLVPTEPGILGRLLRWLDPGSDTTGDLYDAKVLELAEDLGVVFDGEPMAEKLIARSVDRAVRRGQGWTVRPDFPNCEDGFVRAAYRHFAEKADRHGPLPYDEWVLPLGGAEAAGMAQALAAEGFVTIAPDGMVQGVPGRRWRHYQLGERIPGAAA